MDTLLSLLNPNLKVLLIPTHTQIIRMSFDEFFFYVAFFVYSLLVDVKSPSLPDVGVRTRRGPGPSYTVGDRTEKV